MEKLFILSLVCSVAISETENRNDVFTLIENSVSHYAMTGTKPQYLKDVLTDFNKSKEMIRQSFEDNTICRLCEILTELLIMERRLGMSGEDLTNEASIFCIILDIEDERVCRGIIEPNAEIFAYMVDHNPNLTGQRICAQLLQKNSCEKGDNYEWTIDIPERTNSVSKTIKADSSESFKILHLSDIHYDPHYTPNKTKNCGEPLCCQPEQADGSTDEGTACGYWSEMKKADTPMHTVEEVLRQASTQDFDFVYFTGDAVAHKVWATSIENNTEAIKELLEKFRGSFEVPVYFTVGNHEPTPVNTFADLNVTNSNISTQWLFNLFAEELSTWLPEEAQATIQQGGYYSASPRDGLRVVVLNNNVAGIENWWLIHDDFDPYGQLTWLVQTLLEAEQNGEKVHILQHMPTGTDNMIKVWSREYNRIINRFADTISNQFNGHTHKDEFVIYYSRSDETKPINVAWNGASINTDDANPSFKIYQYDSTTFEMLDNELWTFNLTEANLNPGETPEWYKLYSFKDAYGVDGLDPVSLDQLVRRMTTNHTLIEQFHNFRYRNGGSAAAAGCQESCQRDYFCKLTVTEYLENKQCEVFQTLYDESLNK